MEKTRRSSRVEKELKEAIASYFVGPVRTELVGLVTLSRVQVSGDLRNAKVFVSILGEKQEIQESLDVIEEHTPAIQQYINRRIKMKFCPKLRLYLDDWMEQMVRVGEVLKEIKYSTESGNDEDVDS